MIYKVGMLCKHFKGKDLFEKKIYRIERLGVYGRDILDSDIAYTGDNTLEGATNLVVYSNIFQDGKMFAREYEDISSELSDEKKKNYNQILKVEPLTDEEITVVESPSFIEEKKVLVKSKFKK